MTEEIRWTARRKVETLQAIKDGRVTPADLEARFGISAEELAEWQRLYDKFGMPGLRATQLRCYRGDGTTRHQKLRRRP